ncbi:MAG TPA: cupredoxin domain-containing protein [Anaeromyxobacteraceae bacterium]
MRHVILAAALLAGASALAAPPAGAPDAGVPATAPGAARQVSIQVTDRGFEPKEVRVKRGQPTTLVFTRLTDRTCITAIDIPAEGVKKLELPLRQAVSLTITPKSNGIEKFHCTAMGMGGGKIIVED